MRSFRYWGLASVLLLSLAVIVPSCRREAPSSAAPGSLAVSISLEPAEIHVGDMAHLTVIVDHPAAGNLELPVLDQGKAIVVSDQKRKTVALTGSFKGSRERTTFSLFLTSYDLGSHRVGTGKIMFMGQGGRALEIPFPDTALRTKSVLLGEDTPIRGIKGLARWPAPVLRWIALAAGLLLLAAAFFLGARWWQTGRRDTLASTPLPASPHETALKALAVLGGRKLTRQDQVEPFYRELSAIVRRYIEDRFGLRAPEQTTEEFIKDVVGSGLLLSVHQELVQAFLEQCDLVKFARHRPLPDDMTRAFAAAVRLVRETRQLE